MLEGSYNFKINMSGSKCNDVEGIEMILEQYLNKCGFTDVDVECIDFDVNEMED